MKLSLQTVGVAALAMVATASAATAKKQVVLLAGTYTRDEGWVNGTAKGVYAFGLQPTSGKLTPLAVTSTTEIGHNPVFVAGSSSNVIYTVNSVYDTLGDGQTGYVSASTLGSDGSLSVLSTWATLGSSPTHIALSPDEDFLTVANYAGSLVMYPIDPKDGSLGNATYFQNFPDGSGVVPDRQEAGHIHSTTWLPDSSTVVAADLGSDSLWQFTLDGDELNTKDLPVVKRPPGSGPRHMAIHPTARFAFVVDEIANTVGSYKIDADAEALGDAVTINMSTLPKGYTNASTAADLHVSTCGKFLYASNRGHDSIAIFRIDQTSGALTSVGWEPSRGKTPRGFAIYKQLLIVAHQTSGDLFVFRIDAKSGKLKYTGQSAPCPSSVGLYVAELA